MVVVVDTEAAVEASTVEAVEAGLTMPRWAPRALLTPELPRLVPDLAVTPEVTPAAVTPATAAGLDTASVAGGAAAGGVERHDLDRRHGLQQVGPARFRVRWAARARAELQRPVPGERHLDRRRDVPLRHRKRSAHGAPVHRISLHRCEAAHCSSARDRPSACAARWSSNRRVADVAGAPSTRDRQIALDPSSRRTTARSR